MSRQPSTIAAPPAEYSAEERATLLQLAHRAIAAHLGRERLDLTAPSEHLGEKRGAFTTLHSHGQLRGCVGYPLAIAPLYQTIAETAVAAAFQDPRFTPVRAEELPSLIIEISVLSPLKPIAADEVEVGRHGLVVSYGGQRGLLLPQVPIEHGWDRQTFLAQTCIKAGVSPDAWKQGARLEAFSAEVFGE
ncbi:MAG: AmmeMemoRadiSam system protein A [Terriglobales bacterium]